LNAEKVARQEKVDASNVATDARIADKEAILTAMV